MRTEQEVLRDFKKLGYKFEYDSKTKIVLFINKKGGFIVIDKETWATRIKIAIKSDEFKLLHELIEIWRVN